MFLNQRICQFLEIDKKICDLSEKGEDIYKLVTQNVSNAKPDLIISQEICEVCSAYTNQVKKMQLKF